MSKNIDDIFCMNFTDIDDKIIEKSNTFSSFFECSNKYVNICESTILNFNIKTEKDVFFVKATEYVSDIIEMIDIFLSKEFAVILEDGIYFDLNKVEGYLKFKENINRQETNKLFVLWKFDSKEPYWNTPWGKGRPGWHIECSAISKYFLLKYNISRYMLSGGYDLCFPHHENQLILLELFMKLKNKEFEFECFHFGSLFIDDKKNV